MKIEIVPSTSNFEKSKGVLRFTEKDFNHYESFFAKHPHIEPESIDEIRVVGVLEIVKFPQVLIRHIDWLLKEQGTLIIEQFDCSESTIGPFHSYNMVMALISLSFGDRIRLAKKEKTDRLTLTYIKTKQSNPKGDSIKRWSFGICSDGRNNTRILQLIQQIHDFQIPEFEIIICGPAPSKDLPNYVHIIDDSPVYTNGDIRVPISKKKNLIVQNAQYNNMVIMHDRYSFPKDWYEKMSTYGNYFDVLTPSIRDEERPDYRIGDWMSGNLFSFDNGRYMVSPYEELTESSYINGGLFIVKKYLYNQYPIPDELHWAEFEDVIFSNTILQKGYMLQVDPSNPVYSLNIRFGPGLNVNVKQNWINRLAYRRVVASTHLTMKKQYAKTMNVTVKMPLGEYIKTYWYKTIWKITRSIVGRNE